MRRHIRGIACGNPVTPQSRCFDRSSRHQIRQQGRQDNPQKPNTIFYGTSNPRPPNGQRHHSQTALEAAAASLFRPSGNHPRKGIKQSCQVRFFGKKGTNGLIHSSDTRRIGGQRRNYARLALYTPSKMSSHSAYFILCLKVSHYLNLGTSNTRPEWRIS